MNRNNPYTSLSSIIESFVMPSEISEILKKIRYDNKISAIAFKYSNYDHIAIPPLF